MRLPGHPPGSRLDALLPRRPRRRRAELTATDDGSILGLAGSPSPSRRRLLAGLTGPLLAPDGSAHARDPVLALVQRITQGFELAEYERARAMGYDAYLDEQLAPLSIDD